MKDIHEGTKKLCHTWFNYGWVSGFLTAIVTAPILFLFVNLILSRFTGTWIHIDVY